MDENGEAISPERHDIELKQVHFSYGNKEILNEMCIRDSVHTARHTMGVGNARSQ